MKFIYSVKKYHIEIFSSSRVSKNIELSYIINPIIFFIYEYFNYLDITDSYYKSRLHYYKILNKKNNNSKIRKVSIKECTYPVNRTVFLFNVVNVM